MGFTYSYATYNQIIDDVLSSVNEEGRTAPLSADTMKIWIIEAQKKICDAVEVRDKWFLRLATNQSEYPFRDRGAITGATNATPIVITMASHGFANDEFVTGSGVGGNLAANGSFQVKNKTTNTFELYSHASVSNASNDSPIQITTTEEHGFADGSSVTISGVEGNEAANGTFTITFVDALNFTLDGSTGDGNYTSGGDAVQASQGSGAWTAGGRFWSQSELPTSFKRLLYGDRMWSTVRRNVEVKDVQDVLLLRRQATEIFAAFTSYDAPFSMADWVEGGRRKLLVYPPPQQGETMTLYVRLKINQRLHADDDLDSYIQLPNDYEDAVKSYLAYKVYGWLKDKQKEEGNSFTLFQNEIATLARVFPRETTQTITYR